VGISTTIDSVPCTANAVDNTGGLEVKRG